MGSNQICQVKGCSWPVVLCPELCAPHWWKLSQPRRQRILRAQIRGQKDGNHPNRTYTDLITSEIRSLNLTQGNLAKYIHEHGDQDARHSALTDCAACQHLTVHHTIFRGPDTLMVCDECQSMIPSILPGSQRLAGMEPTP